MKKISIVPLGIVIGLLLVNIVAPATSFAQSSGASGCIALQNNLSYGMQSSDVMTLQSYLAAQGDLSATPTGYFGGLTLAAVKAFQNDNGISATGFVGPLTRARLQTISCASATTQTTVPVPAQQSTPVAATMCSVAITSPYPEEAYDLSIDTVTVTWNNTNCNPALPVAVILEHGGQAQSWNITGTASVTASSTTLTPDLSNLGLISGEYQILLERTDSGQAISVPVQIYINAPAVISTAPSLTSLSQTTAPADGATLITVYGSGFDASSIVYIGGTRGVPVTPTAIDPSGKYLSFSIASSTNVYGATGVSVFDGGKWSNQLPLTVTAPQTSSYQLSIPYLPAGNAGVFYSTTVNAIGFSNNYTWAVSSGTLPPGISIANSSSGYFAPAILSGVPQTPGNYTFTLTATDTAGNVASRSLTITIANDPNANSGVPALYSLSTNTGPVGTTITLTGARFTGSNYVLMDGRVASPSLSSSDGTTLSFTIPVSTKPACNLFSTGQICPTNIQILTPTYAAIEVENSGGTSGPRYFILTL